MKDKATASPEVYKSRTLQALWLVLANALSLSASLIIAAILSRYMTEAEYGTYRQVLYVYNTLLIVFSLGLPRAYSYFLARVSVEEGKDVVRKLNVLFLLLSSLFSCFLFCGASTIAGWLGNPLLTEPLRYFAVTPMLLMPVLGTENILIVYGMSRLVVVYVMISRVFTIACAVLPVVVFNTGVLGAVIGFVIASLITCIIGLRLSFMPFRSVFLVKTGLTVRDLFRFLIPVFTSSIYGFVIGSASQFFVSRYFGVEDFALFANGYRELPLAGMIIGATASLLLPEFSRMSNTGADSGRFVELWKGAVFKSALIIYPLSVFCCVFAQEIICLLYGDGYREAANLFQIVTLINLMRIMPYAPVLFALGKGKAFAGVHFVTAVLIVGLDIWCVKMFPSLSAIALIATCCTLFCLMLLMTVTARLLKISLAGLMPWKMMLKILLVSVAACTVTKLAVSWTGITHHLTVVLLGFSIYLLFYMLFSTLTGIRYAEVFGSVISRMKTIR